MPFKKGGLPWNKGLKGSYSINKGENNPMYGKTHTEEYKKWLKNNKSGSNNNNWRDDNVGYSGLHQWVVKQLGQPTECEYCGKDGLTGRFIQWANISGEYKRDLSDWIRLCAKCHWNYDRRGIQKP